MTVRIRGRTANSLGFWKAWGYDIQAAIYREIRAQNDGEIKPFRLAVATKETETDLQIFEFIDETLDEAYRTGLQFGSALSS